MLGGVAGGAGRLPESTRKNSCAAPLVTGLVQLKFPFASKMLVATADQFVAASARFVADITRYVAPFEPPMPASTMLPELSQPLVMISGPGVAGGLDAEV